MSIIKFTDFYYGAVLSMLLNSNITPVLVEGDDSRQVYDLTTDKNECRLFVKYRAFRQDTKSKDYNSWQFNLTERDKGEIHTYLNEGYNLIVALVCGVEGLSDSELALVDKKQVKELIDLGKYSVTISRIKGEHAYRISIGGGRENAMQVTANRFEELF